MFPSSVGFSLILKISSSPSAARVFTVYADDSSPSPDLRENSNGSGESATGSASSVVSVLQAQTNRQVIDPRINSGASAKLCESICGMQKRTGRFNGTAYDLAKQDDRSYNP